MTTERNIIREKSLKMAIALGRAIGESRIIDDPDLLKAYSKDESHVPPSMPDIAVRAESEDDIAAVLKMAPEFAVPVIPRGAGTGKSGGAIPVNGGLVLDLSKMNRLIEIDRENLLAIVQPGIITGVLQAQVEAEGLFYPPDPNSLETCTVGGNVAHNAGGPRAFKYGVTRNYVMATRTLLMGGTALRTGTKTIKRVAGYDLTSLLVGSEGTLGVFSELTLRLVANPPHIATLLIPMPDEASAGRAIAKIVAAGLVPRVLEFMDNVLVKVLREKGVDSVAEDTGALILAEVDGPTEESVESDAVRLAELCESAGAGEVLMARHGGERERLWAARRVLSDAIKSRGKYKVSEDIVITRSNGAALLEGLHQLSQKHGVLVASYGHAGDGNYHVNVLWDDPAFSPDAVVDDVFKMVWRLDGTITGEHGVALSKKKYLPLEQSAELISLQKSLKNTFDPRGLLNPGKIFL